ncbi:MAG: hypothetical protein RR311_03850 [Comamonas sp.]
MVTTPSPSTANYFVPIPNQTMEISEVSQPAPADSGNEAAPHHLNAQDIRNTAVQFLQIIHQVKATVNWIESKHCADPSPSAHLVRKSLHSTTQKFIYCAEMLSSSFGSFNTASVELSTQSRECLKSAKEVAVELESIALVFSSALPAGTENSQTIRNGISLNFYAADVAAKTLSFLADIFYMAGHSNHYVGGVANEEMIAWKKRSNTDFEQGYKANSALFSTVNYATPCLINACENLISTIHAAFPAPANIHSLYVDIFRKALLPVNVSIRTSLAFLNLYNVLGDIRNNDNKRFSEIFITAESQVETAYQAMNAAIENINRVAFTAAYAIRPPSNLYISLKDITNGFNSASDHISSFISANQSINNIIEENFNYPSIRVPLEATKIHAYTLFGNLISLQKSINQTLAYSITSALENDIGVRFPHPVPGVSNPASTVTSPYIDIESLTRTAARLTSATAFVFRSLHTSLGEVRGAMPQDLEKYQKWSLLSLAASKSVHKSIKHYDAIAVAALEAAKNENFTLQKFQRNTSVDYQYAQAAITEFRTIQHRLFEELGKNTFSKEIQKKIEHAKNVGLTSSEAFNAISAHPFFATASAGPQTGNIFSQKDLAFRNISEPSVDIENTPTHSIHTLNRHLPIFSNIRISSRICTTISTSTSALLALEKLNETLAKQSSSIHGKSNIYETSINSAQTLLSHTLTAKHILLAMFHLSDQAALDATEIPENYEYYMEEINEVVSQAIAQYKDLRSKLQQTPVDEKTNGAFKNIQLSFASFIESFYSFYFYTNEIRIDSMKAANDFSTYEVESSKIKQASTNAEKENVLEIMALPQTSTYNGQVE